MRRRLLDGVAPTVTTPTTARRRRASTGGAGIAERCTRVPLLQRMAGPLLRRARAVRGAADAERSRRRERRLVHLNLRVRRRILARGRGAADAGAPPTGAARGAVCRRGRLRVNPCGAHGECLDGAARYLPARASRAGRARRATRRSMRRGPATARRRPRDCVEPGGGADPPFVRLPLRRRVEGFHCDVGALCAPRADGRRAVTNGGRFPARRPLVRPGRGAARSLRRTRPKVGPASRADMAGLRRRARQSCRPRTRSRPCV